MKAPHTRRLVLLMMLVANAIAWGALFQRDACQEGAARAQAPPDVKQDTRALPPPDHEPSSASRERPTRAHIETKVSSTLQDKGLFEAFDEEVRPVLPSWVDRADVTFLRHKQGDEDTASSVHFAMVAGVIVAEVEAPSPDTVYPPVIDVTRWSEALDADQDGIPDQLDIARGALKAARNGARYEGGYERLDYPGGDVSMDKGVCTDVVIRAVRNAGIDLQVELFEEIGASPRSFPMVKKRDPNIDQRRVKTLLPYFKRRWESLPIEVGGVGKDSYLPGDIVFMQTMGDARPDHLGVVTDTVGESGYPLVINNWTDGYTTSKMDLLGVVPVTHRFRRKAPLPEATDGSQRGLEGVLVRHGIELEEEVEQVLLVTTSSWSSTRGELRLYERPPKSADGATKLQEALWSRADRRRGVIEVNLGRGGSGKGRGLKAGERVGEGVDRIKREGDGRSPAGVFSLGIAFGEGSNPLAKSGSDWPWHEVKRGDVWVDDPESRRYNTLVTSGEKERAFSSAEDLTTYDLALVVKHNTQSVQRGAGSAIFLHTLTPGEGATAGCTSMPREDLLGVLGWLKVEKNPVLVHVVGEVL